MKISELVLQLPKSDDVIITGHIHPDGDCIGSTLALSLVLKKYGYRTQVILEERSTIYSYLPGFDAIKTYEEFFGESESGIEGSYSMIVMDSGDLSRIEPMRTVFERATVTVDVDHHDSNTFFGDYNIVDVKASSTCELVGILLGLANGPDKNQIDLVLDRDIATCLYTGIIYDTGVFKHSNTRKETHLVTSALLEQGVDFNFMINHLYFRRSKKSIIANKIALINIEFHEAIKGVSTVVFYQDLKENELIKSDTEMIVSMLNEIEDTYTSIFFLEVREGEFKVSFRSSSKVNVCEVAKQFNGGGHIKAAGCTVLGSFSDVKEKVLKELMSEYKRNY